MLHEFGPLRMVNIADLQRSLLESSGGQAAVA
jgi:hypothetical protein